MVEAAGHSGTVSRVPAPLQRHSRITWQNWTGLRPPNPGATANVLGGVTVVSACHAWAALRLTRHDVPTMLGPGSKLGLIVSMSPAPGTTIAPGSVVDCGVGHIVLPPFQTSA